MAPVPAGSKRSVGSKCPSVRERLAHRAFGAPQLALLVGLVRLGAEREADEGGVHHAGQCTRQSGRQRRDRTAVLRARLQSAGEQQGGDGG
jgi:hypothetical protein